MIIVANANGTTDGPAYQMLSQVNSSIHIVLISRANDFRFNEELHKLDRYVLACFCEYGWNVDLKDFGTHLWGDNTDLYKEQFDSEEYDMFDAWVKSNPPVLTLKRELLEEDRRQNILPIEYPCWNHIPPIQSKEAFDNRIFEVFFFWGRSHEDRLRLHSEIWLQATNGYSVCDNIYYVNQFAANEEGKRWVSLWMPHYSRVDISHLLSINENAKISIAMPGAGLKTFRHLESSLNSVMAMWKDGLAWTFPWDTSNSIQTEQCREILDIRAALENPFLYNVYVNGVENCRKYHISNYIPYLEKVINERL